MVSLLSLLRYILGNLIQVINLAWRILYPLSHLPASDIFKEKDPKLCVVQHWAHVLRKNIVKCLCHLKTEEFS